VIVASPRRAGHGNPPTSAATENGNLHRRVDSKGARGSAAVGTPIALAIQRGGCRGHGRASGMDGVDDLGVLDALQGDRGGAEVGVAQLTLDDVEGDAFVGQLDGVTRRSGCGARPRPSRATTCRWCRTADRPASPHERDPRAAGARSSGRRCRPRVACRACRGGSRNGGRLDVRLGDGSFGLRSGTAGESPRSEGRPPIRGW
jgi:hypothetical protein